MADEVRQQIKSRVLDAHRETITAVCDVGRAVTTSWQGSAVTDASRITESIHQQFEETTLPQRLLETLETAADTTDSQMQGSPVPAPPYLVVTSRGPVCRVTLEDGRRVVLLFELFTVDRRPRAYQFRDPSPSTCLRVRIRGR